MEFIRCPKCSNTTTFTLRNYTKDYTDHNGNNVYITDNHTSYQTDRPTVIECSKCLSVISGENLIDAITQQNKKNKTCFSTWIYSHSTLQPWGRDNAYDRYYRCIRCGKEVMIDSECERVLPHRCPCCNSLMDGVYL